MKKKKLKAYIKELEAHVGMLPMEKSEKKEEEHYICYQDYLSLEEARKDLEVIRKGAAKANTIKELEERLEFAKLYGVDPMELRQGA